MRDDVSNRVFQEAEQMLSVPGELTTPDHLVSCFWIKDNMRRTATEDTARRFFRFLSQFVCSIFCRGEIIIHTYEKVYPAPPRTESQHEPGVPFDLLGG